MVNITYKNPFITPFLDKFILAPDILPFTDNEIFGLDKELFRYERLFLNPDIEKYLISKNELLTSFAVSKAEDSTLTLKEAEEIYELIIKNPDYKFIGDKLGANKKLTRKDYEKVEFFNIVKTFKKFNQSPFSLRDLSPMLIQDIHYELTKGLDVFQRHLPGFDVYKSGKWRDNDKIRVGEYIPAPYKIIAKGVEELITWLNKNKTITSVAVFHTALYGLHPFNNGNKRVCRILEHILLRQLELNVNNLYSTSYYYHKEKARYYKYLLYSLEHKNFNHFSSFVLEAIVFSIISVLKSGIEIKRKEFLKRANLDISVRNVLTPLVKRKEAQFKTLFKLNKRKIARQTFVTYLKKAAEKNIIIKREEGRATYYSLNFSIPEEKKFQDWVESASKKLSYLPEDIRLG